jgi:hypothetical protein
MAIGMEFPDLMGFGNVILECPCSVPDNQGLAFNPPVFLAPAPRAAVFPFCG